MKKTMEMKLKKEHGRVNRYYTEDPDAVVDTVYVSHALCKGKDKITLTIEA